MKKLTSKEPISFRVNAQTLLEISPEGCLCADEYIKTIKERLGDNVMVSDIEPEEAVKEILSKTETAPEAAPEPVVAPEPEVAPELAPEAPKPKKAKKTK